MPKITREMQTEVYGIEVACRPGQDKLILLLTCKECKGAQHIEGFGDKSSAIEAARFKGWSGGSKAGWLCPNCKARKQ
jgi:hypothetical protein